MSARLIPFRVPAILVLLCVVVGCVPYKTYEDTRLALNQAVKVNEDLSAKLNQLAQAYSGLKGGGDFGDEAYRNLEARLIHSNQVNDELRRRLDGLDDGRFEGPRFSKADFEAVPGVVWEDGKLIISDSILFNSGEASLKSTAQKTLDQLAGVLKTRYPGEVFDIVGHTDNVPLVKTRKRWRTNMRLGFERAYAVFQFLQLNHSMSEDQFLVHSYGFLRPTNPATQNTTAGRAKNRRVEIYRAGAKI